MSKFVLQPAKILLGRSFVPDRTQDFVQKTFSELSEMLVPDRNLGERSKLGLLKPSTYVGVCKHSKDSQRRVVFILRNMDGSGNFETVLKTDPGFTDRVLTAYRVETAEYDVEFEDRTVSPVDAMPPINEKSIRP